MQGSYRLLGAVAALAILVGGTAAAQEDPAALQACVACHGANGISVGPEIPNLAGQRAHYMKKQLKAFRAGERDSAIMGAIAGQLDDATIDALAAYFGDLPGVEEPETSVLPPALAETRVTFPTDYAESFTYYMTRDFPKIRQIRRYFANAPAALAAKKGEAMPDGAYFLVEVSQAKEDEHGDLVTGAEGQLAPDGIIFYLAMETGEDWGAEIPEILRNGDWNYAIFGKELEPKIDNNQALCLACHKPHKADNYLFSLEDLQGTLAE